MLRLTYSHSHKLMNEPDVQQNRRLLSLDFESSPLDPFPNLFPRFFRDAHKARVFTPFLNIWGSRKQGIWNCSEKRKGAKERKNRGWRVQSSWKNAKNFGGKKGNTRKKFLALFVRRSRVGNDFGKRVGSNYSRLFLLGHWSPNRKVGFFALSILLSPFPF